MSQIDVSQEDQSDEPIEMIVDYRAECPSISTRSNLSYEAGRRPNDVHNIPYLRISRNSGGGMFCKDWAPIAQIDALIAKSAEVTARTFDEVHPRRSINTGGFLLAIVKDLGVVQPKQDNTRHHERVPGASVLQALSKRITEANAVDDGGKTRRKKAE